ncbi:cilia- and flagella-associated protein 157 isoform X2 [Trichomycterus rosablanca]|uniref:cilia- and flagella-associated protein 157 isoform X2 n=1 Tax=Trichomycterus rosablanca TaxID=2290929 RepID=UPI002F360062
MPPKKSAKKTAEKPSKKENAEHGEKSEDGLSEGGKEFYRAQIRDLEERLEKYQHKCDELEIREKDFSATFKNVEREKNDIVRYLKRSLAQKEDELTDLSEKLQELQNAKDEEKKEYELQLSMLRHEFQKTKDKLTSENMALAGKLASLEDFRMQKDELMALLASLKEQLEQQEQEHQIVIYNLEKKAVLDNDRLKKEMQQHVTAVAAEFRKLSDKKMPETMMRAIQENVAVTAQLRQFSDKTKVLLEENSSLKTREQQLKREMEIMEPMLNEMTRKNLGNQKVVQQLTEKCKQMHTELQNYVKFKEESQQLLNNHTTLQKEHDDLRLKHESVKEDLNQKQAQAERLKEELLQEKIERERLEMVVHEAAVALREALMGEPEEEDTEVQTLVQRNQMMQKLLTLLDSAAAIDKGLVSTDFMSTREQTHDFMQTPGLDRPGLFMKATSHFKTGDLGLVPRKTPAHSSVPSNIRPCSLQRKQQNQERTKPSNSPANTETHPLQPESVIGSQRFQTNGSLSEFIAT